MTYLIISENKDNHQNLQKDFSHFQDYTCLGFAENYDKALRIIIKQKPTIIFIDVDALNSFDFINEVKLISYTNHFVVALSINKDQCYKALKHNFFDYLILPLKEIEILKCFLKVSKQENYNLKKNICLKSYNDFHYLDTKNILFLKADNNTTDFYALNADKTTAFKTLKTYESLLPNNFLRVHKSYIINTDFINRINFGKSVCVIDGTHKHNIPFSNKYYSKIVALNKRLTNQSFIEINNVH
ncbi:LytR/AlgR family response regulator transcription factor [Winogradskyella sp.]|uniref:LytR/AlgR family response regulator transcription factor n=1 Tax=Winogradskyella sp. TaxID=1883156 RepID=UPI003AB11D4C